MATGTSRWGYSKPASGDLVSLFQGTIGTTLDSIDANVTTLSTINPKDPPYNAKFDGVTDDTTAIQTAAYAAAGQRLVLPPGIAMVSATIDFGIDAASGNYQSGTIVQGSGCNLKGTVIRAKSTISGPVIRIDGQQCDISGIMADGNSLATNGIQAFNTAEGVIRNCNATKAVAHNWLFNCASGAGPKAGAGFNDGLMVIAPLASASGTLDVQTVGVGAASAGTFTLTFGGQTTGAIAYNASAAAVQSALVALSSIGNAPAGAASPNVVVTGAAPTWTVTFKGQLVGLQTVMTGSGAGLTGGALTITHTTPGVLGCGYYTDSTMGTDNGPMYFLNPRATAQNGHGMLWSTASGLHTVMGDIESNAGFGIQLGIAGDSTTLVDAIIDGPWLEGNYAGGGRFQGCARCRAHNMSGTQPWTDSSASYANWVLDSTNSGATFTARSPAEANAIQLYLEPRADADYTIMGSQHPDTTARDFHIQGSKVVLEAPLTVQGVVVSQGGLTSGSLPTATLSSGTGAQIISSRDVTCYTPVTFTPTAGASATCTIAVSADNVTYSTIGVETVPAGVALDNFIRVITVALHAGWYIKLTVVNATIGTTTYD